MTARPFVLVRHVDPTGISGIGIIGEGVAWTGGSACLHWMTEHESFVHWPGGLPEILAVHGHNGSTIARFLDEPEAPIDAPSNHDESPLETFDREDR